MPHTNRKASRALFFALLGAVLLPVAWLHAQRAPEGPLVFRVPASARAAAIGNVGISLTDGDALFYNPAQVLVQRGLAASVQRYGAGAVAGSMGTATTVGPLTLGVGVQHLRFHAASDASYGAVVEPGATHLADGGAAPGVSTAFTMAAAKTVKDVRLGAALTYAEEQVGATVDGTVAMDVGVSKTFRGITYGAVVHHLGAGLHMRGVSAVLPTTLTLGAGIQQAIAPAWDLGGQAALQVGRDGVPRPAGGVEVSYVPIDGVSVVWRAGVRMPREQDALPVTGGMGLMIDHVLIDYALEPMRAGRPVAHRIGIRLR